MRTIGGYLQCGIVTLTGDLNVRGVEETWAEETENRDGTRHSVAIEVGRVEKTGVVCISKQPDDGAWGSKELANCRVTGATFIEVDVNSGLICEDLLS